PRISTIQIDPEKIGLLIGKGGETVRALQEEFEAQIDIGEDGQVLVYAADGARGDALVDRIRAMTKDVEVGDEFTGRVVKTTAFDPVATDAVHVVSATVTVGARAGGSATATQSAPARSDPGTPPGDARIGRPDRDGGDALRPVRVAGLLGRNRLADRIRGAG